MRDLRVERVGAWIWFVAFLTVACENDSTTPLESPEQQRQLQPAVDGEMGVSILINGNPLNNQSLADRLHVVFTIDSPTYAGNNNDKTVEISPTHYQADSVGICASCEANVIYHDLFGGLPPGGLNSDEGALADGDYTVKLYKDGSTLVGSQAIAVNHTNGGQGDNNGTFLNEATDQIVTFYLNSSLNQISSPTVSNQHTRASTHLSATITQPAGSDTTVNVNTSLTVAGSASNGLTGTTKKYAWDWDASGGSQETFDTEFSTSTSASHTYTSTGDYKIRLIARDGNDDGYSGTHGGHYAVSATKTVHVVGVDSATSQGNTFPSTIDCGGSASVTLTMKNSGTSTWTTAYDLKLVRETGYWMPTSVDLTSSVAPNQSKQFSFYLTHIEPLGVGSTVDAYYRMENANDVLFGQENGRGIYVQQGSPPCALGPQGSITPAPDLAGEPVAWAAGMTSDGRVDLALDREGLASRGFAAFPFHYLHDRPREVDVVLRFEYDPAVLAPAAPVPGEGVADVAREAGVARPGEYWARLRGPVPAGSGQIAWIPFRLVEGASVPSPLGTVTLFHP